ncbi:hypothetical protein [Actinoplanes missouriensis]|uniref:hypothetical protein n=1 Tax=Actinoplanes missouriensis TaxID=1866 RepID=UPI0036CC6F46
MQLIRVDAEGITVTLVHEPIVPVFGKEMWPGSTEICQAPWPEISGVSLAVT